MRDFVLFEILIRRKNTTIRVRYKRRARNGKTRQRKTRLFNFLKILFFIIAFGASRERTITINSICIKHKAKFRVSQVCT